MTEAEQRRRARDLERRLRALGIHCPPGTLEPLTSNAHLARSTPAGPIMQGQIRRVFEPPAITVR